MPVVQVCFVYEDLVGDAIRKYNVRFWVPLPDVGNIKETENVAGLTASFLFLDECYTEKDSQLQIVLAKDAIDDVHELDIDDPADHPDAKTNDDILERINDGIARAKDTIKFQYDSHHDCYCKTQKVCGCGCDPKHNGW